MNFKSYSNFFIIVTLLLIFISCSPRINKGSSGDEKVIYPAAPDTAKIQYLTSISSSLNVTNKQSAFTKSIVGEKKVLPILKPYGLFMRNGKLYVCDVSLAGLEIMNFEKNEFEYFIPEGQYRLKLPLNCYVDENDQLYVVDINQRKIAIFDKEGKYITSFGKKENVKPSDVFVFQNKAFVADSGNNRINVYNKTTHKFEYYFPKSESGDDSFLYKPANITVSKDKVYVSDMGSGNIKIFTHEGKYISTVGKYGKNIGEFVRPKGIAVDRDSNLYVVDASFENVQIFNKKGELLMFFGGHYIGAGDLWLPTKIMIDYDNIKYFQKYVDPKFDLEYLIFVANQYGPDKVNVYGRIHPKKNKN